MALFPNAFPARWLGRPTLIRPLHVKGWANPIFVPAEVGRQDLQR
jgi:hypothetical protein